MLSRQMYVIKKYIHIGVMRLRILSMKNAFESRDTESEKDLMILYFSILSVWKEKPFGNASNAMSQRTYQPVVCGVSDEHDAT